MKRLLILISCAAVLGLASAELSAEQFTTYLEEQLNATKQSSAPANAFEYKPKCSGKPTDLGDYDFIVVGAGSTGCAIANRLSEEKRWKVLLIEAGWFPNNFTRVPWTMTYLWTSTWSWGYKSIPQTNSCVYLEGSQCLIGVGRGVGGTSIMNNLVYVRDHPDVYKRWQDTVRSNDPIKNLVSLKWDYNDVLPFLKKSEEMSKNTKGGVVDWPIHGTNGPLYTEYTQYTVPVMDAFNRANEAKGYKLTDVNSRNQIGYSPVPYNVKDGKRVASFEAYIEPILNRPNLDIKINCLVTKINLRGKRAEGVTFACNGSMYKASAKKEVVLSAGAVGSARLLMLSGIGPEEQLKENNIPVVQDLAVGKVFREKPMLRVLTFSTNLTAPNLSMLEQVRQYLNATGPLTIADGIYSLGFYSTKVNKHGNVPDLEMMINIVNCQDNPNVYCFTLIPLVTSPQSQGYIRLKNNDPYDYPIIDSAMLTDAEDWDRSVLVEGVKFILDLVETPPFKKINAKFIGLPAPSPCVEGSADYWKCVIRHFSIPLFHVQGSCPMGSDPKKGAVVDDRLKVHGINRLRVADASVFPFVLDGHPHVTCVMVGERLAHELKIKYPFF